MIESQKTPTNGNNEANHNYKGNYVQILIGEWGLWEREEHGEPFPRERSLGRESIIYTQTISWIL